MMFSQTTKTSNNLYGRVGVDTLQAREDTFVIGMGYEVLALHAPVIENV